MHASLVVFAMVPRVTNTMQNLKFVVRKEVLGCFTYWPKMTKNERNQPRSHYHVAEQEQRKKKKRKKKKRTNSPYREQRADSPQPISLKCSSTLSFSLLKTSLLDISSGYGVKVEWCA